MRILKVTHAERDEAQAEDAAAQAEDEQADKPGGRSGLVANPGGHVLLTVRTHNRAARAGVLRTGLDHNGHRITTGLPGHHWHRLEPRRWRLTWSERWRCVARRRCSVAGLHHRL